jgi:hypothetical protein
MDAILIGRPSVVASNWKCTAHTTFDASAVAGSVSLRRPGACVGAVAARGGPVAPQPLDLLVVDVPTLGAGVVISRTNPRRG